MARRMKGECPGLRRHAASGRRHRAQRSLPRRLAWGREGPAGSRAGGVRPQDRRVAGAGAGGPWRREGGVRRWVVNRAAASQSPNCAWPTRRTPNGDRPPMPSACLLELLRLEGSLAVAGLETLLRRRSEVGSTPKAAALGRGRAAGESRSAEGFRFFSCLARQLDRYVPCAPTSSACRGARALGERTPATRRASATASRAASSGGSSWIRPLPRHRRLRGEGYPPCALGRRRPERLPR